MSVPILFDSQLGWVVGFLAFGLGTGAPVLALSLDSQRFVTRVTRKLARHSGPVNRVTGAVMLLVSAY